MEPQGLATEAMAAMTREMNFSECTFALPAEAAGTDLRLRIFGRAGNEMPFAGHPVIGSAFALADDGVIAAGRPRVHVRPRHRSDAGGARVGRRPPALRLDDAAAARPSAPSLPAERRRWPRRWASRPAQLVPNLPVQEVSCGSAFFYAPLTTRAAVDAVQMNGRELDAVFKQAGVQRRGIFVFTTETGRRRRHRLQPDGRRHRLRGSGDRLGQRPARLLPRAARTGAGGSGRRASSARRA